MLTRAQLLTALGLSAAVPVLGSIANLLFRPKER